VSQLTWQEFKVGLIEMSFKIPVMQPSLPSFTDVQPLLQSIDTSHIYSNMGPLVQALENEYASYLGMDPSLVVAVGNATQALQGLLAISEPENWYCPDYTFSATGLAVLNAKKILHLCDVNINSWKIDADDLPKVSDSIGILPVMPFGAEVCFSDYQEFTHVIIDAAASLGRIPPKASDMKRNWGVVYSLHATKVLGAGEGAIAVCGSQEMAHELRAWLNFGFSDGRESKFLGTNAKMSEFNAAYGLASLRRFDYEESLWMHSQEAISHFTKGKRWATQVNVLPAFQPYWIAEFRNAEERNYVSKALFELQVQTRCWWEKPLSQQPAFSSSKKIGGNINSDFLASTHLGLPMYQGLHSEDINFVVDSIEETLTNYSGGN
jgi:dTDP-4-amino-4,6-dideoxygalactose transaminase